MLLLCAVVGLWSALASCNASDENDLVSERDSAEMPDEQVREVLLQALVRPHPVRPMAEEQALDGERPLSVLPEADQRVVDWLERREFFTTIDGDDALFKQFVYRGREDLEDEFEDCVAVGDETRFFCSGTVVGKNMVISAKHCLEEGAVSRIFVGSEVNPATGKILNLSGDPIVNPDADLMILVLEEPVTVQPREIADPSLADTSHWLRIAGFGNTDISGTTGYGHRRWGDVFSESCNEVNSQDLGCAAGNELVTPPEMAGWKGEPCTGDSGGPAYVYDGENYLLAGAMSRGTLLSGVGCGKGAIYARVDLDEVRAWIGSIPGGPL